MRWVEFCHRHAVAVVIVAVAAAAISGVYAARTLGIDTDTAKMMSAELPWRKAQIEYDRAFPRDLDLTIVIDAPTSDAAGDAASALAARLAARKDLFTAVQSPTQRPFFRRNGLLFLSTEELANLTDQLIEMQPMIGSLAADPTLRGLFRTLAMALDGVAQGRAPLDLIEAPLAAVADAVEASVAGRVEPISWQALLTGQGDGAAGRSFVLVEPVRDFSALEPGARARKAVREEAAALGLTPENGYRVRQTGSVALNDEEFSTVAEGTGGATIGAFLLVCVILYLAMRSWRLVLASQINLLIGLVLTAGFAALTVGTLNLISVAFAVLFVGIAVDFSIQYAVLYRSERHRIDDLKSALSSAAGHVSGALTLATLALMAGFFSFLPTDYKGVSELGLISGAGMVIALFLNFTLLPALLTLLKPGGERKPIGYAWAAPIDRFLSRRRYAVLAAAGIVAVVGLALLPRLHFDFNPLHLKDPSSESVSTLMDLMSDPITSPNSVDVLVPNAAAAERMADRLRALPEVGRVMTLASFVPSQQKEKLDILADAKLVLLPTLSARPDAPPNSDREALAAMRDCIAKLEKLAAGRPQDGPLQRLADALEAAVAKGPEVLPLLRENLMADFSRRLQDLRLAMQAQPVTLSTLPADIKRDWIAPDGRQKVTAYPEGDGRSNEVLREFVEAVRTVAPSPVGTPVSIQKAGDTVVDAFMMAGTIAFVLISVLLRLALGRWLDVALVLAPLGLAALLTVITSVIGGLPINFANIITLPLLLGIGVAFDIYFVVNWRGGITGPLQSSTARAILFSALTTVCAFGSLALSSHPGTADMGILLTISLFYALLCTLFVLPAMLAAATPFRRH